MGLTYKTEIHLAYRKRGRQMEDPNLAFNEARQVLGTLEPVRVRFSEVTENHWPIPPESVEKVEENGIFVVNADTGHPKIVVRELPIIVTCDSFEDAEVRLQTILSESGLTFAVVRIVREYTTDHFAD